MKKNKIFLFIGIAMFIIAIGFIIYAFNNPQASFPWSNSITYGIYLIYIVVTISFSVKGLSK